MLVLTLRFVNKPSSGPNRLGDLSEDVVISKALEIVQWKGWESKEQKVNRKSESNPRNDFKPIVPARSAAKERTESLKSDSRRTASDSKKEAGGQAKNEDKMKITVYPADQVRLVKQPAKSADWKASTVDDQIDDLDTSFNTYSSVTSNSDLDSELNSPGFTIASSPESTTLRPTGRFKPMGTFKPIDEPTGNTISANDALKKAFENIEDIKQNHSCGRPKGRLFNLKEINHDYRFYLPK